MKACRKHGIVSIKVDSVEFVLGSLPNQPAVIDETAFPEASIQVPQYNGPISPPEAPKEELLTEEQLMFYSAQSHDQVEQ